MTKLLLATAGKAMTGGMPAPETVLQLMSQLKPPLTRNVSWGASLGCKSLGPCMANAAETHSACLLPAITAGTAHNEAKTGIMNNIGCT